MKKSDMLFALLRKSAVLKDCVSTDTERKYLLNLKYQYSKLQPSLRNMIRIMATDVDRFNLINGEIATISSVLENYHLSGSERPENGVGHPALVDTITDNRFIIMRRTIMSNGVVVFKDEEHQAFVVAYGCLARAKIHQEKIIRENEIEQKRLNILSEFI